MATDGQPAHRALTASACTEVVSVPRIGPSSMTELMGSTCKLQNMPRAWNPKSEHVTRGFCYPQLVCPAYLPIAFLESARSGCTSFKVWTAKMDGIRWEGHGKTKLRCCTDREAAHRLKVLMVRNPFSRAISIFSHPLYRSVGGGMPLTNATLANFTRWLTYEFNQPDHGEDVARHFRSQVQQFHDPRQKKGYNMSDFFLIHLETLEADLAALKSVLKVCFDFRKRVPRFPYENHARTEGRATAAIFADAPEAALLLRMRYADDFALLGYDTNPLCKKPLPRGTA